MAATVDPSTSVKRALIVGCNYKGSSKPLLGCINDAQLWHNVLVDCFGFSENNITVLTDKEASGPTRASSDRIKDTLNSLVASSKPGDVLFFAFSGHGSQTTDLSGDEVDEKDELLVTAGTGSLLDDELREIFANLESGVKFTMFSDSCHSGTILDKTETILDGEGDMVENANGEEVKSGVMTASDFDKFLFMQWLSSILRGLTPSELKEFMKAEGSNVKSTTVKDSTGTTATKGTCQSYLHRGMILTGCRSTELSSETITISQHTRYGLFTYLATEQIRAFKKDNKRIMTNKELVWRVNYLIQKLGYTQHVRLEGLPGQANEQFILW